MSKPIIELPQTQKERNVRSKEATSRGIVIAVVTTNQNHTARIDEVKREYVGTRLNKITRDRNKRVYRQAMEIGSTLEPPKPE